MTSRRLVITALMIAVLSPVAMGQRDTSTTSQAAGAQTAGPTYEVVSIKRNTAGTTSTPLGPLPPGDYMMGNGPLSSLISTAYPGLPNPEGLPVWARTEHYDVTAKAPRDMVPTADDKRAMMRALLAERLKFAAHIDTRDQPVFDLVFARSDHRLGPGLTKIDIDCAARAAERAAAAQAARAAGTPVPQPSVTQPTPGSSVPPCSSLSAGNRLEGDYTLAGLAGFLRNMAGRTVIDKTGLAGYYRVRLESAPRVLAPTPAATARVDDRPSIFIAVQEQLGLKLEPSRAQVDVLVIDHIERPSAN